MRHRAAQAAAAAIIAAASLALPAVAAAHDGPSGFVYTESNAATGNAILAFARGADGTLTPAGSYATGGLGTGAGLATQGEVVLGAGGQWLFAVNAGSSDVSAFRVRDDGSLRLVDRVASGGGSPVSVTVHDDLVYVLNGGGPGGIAGFRFVDGRLRHIAGSDRPLSGAATNPAEVAFSSDGRFLIVTERATSMLDTYRVADDGTASGPVSTASSGPVPYGFAFDRHDHPIVSEAANSTMSSYRLSASGATPISASIPTGGLAACWVAVTPDGRWAFDSNAHGGTISSFAVSRDGSIALVASVAADTGAGSAPLDLAVSAGGGNLYVLEAGHHAIGGYRMVGDGTLAPVAGAPAVPASASGLAAS